MLPSVSEPSVTAAKPMDAATPEPEEEPQGSACGKYAFVHCPPRPDHPDAMLPRKCAHSDRFAFPVAKVDARQTPCDCKGNKDVPSMIAPPLRRFLTTPASSGTMDPSRLNEPAVVFMPEKMSGDLGCAWEIDGYLRKPQSRCCP